MELPARPVHGDAQEIVDVGVERPKNSPNVSASSAGSTGSRSKAAGSSLASIAPRSARRTRRRPRCSRPRRGSARTGRPAATAVSRGEIPDARAAPRGRGAPRAATHPARLDDARAEVRRQSARHAVRATQEVRPQVQPVRPAGSDRTRPPSRSSASRRRTSRSRNSQAAARPASPPPTITTSCRCASSNRCAGAPDALAAADPRRGSAAAPLIGPGRGRRRPAPRPPRGSDPVALEDRPDRGLLFARGGDERVAADGVVDHAPHLEGSLGPAEEAGYEVSARVSAADVGIDRRRAVLQTRRLQPVPAPGRPYSAA